MIFDTHAHYDDEQFDQDRDALLASLQEQGIEAVVNIGADLASTKNSLALAERYPFVYAAAGVHPDNTKELNEENFAWLREAAQTPKVVAVGEIGLDYYWDETPRDVQKHWFEAQMELARQINKPIVVHSREAARDTLEVMKASRAEEIGGVIHCFSYSVEMARAYLNMGYYLGIGGVLTFNNAKKLKEVAAYAPMDRLVLETDCPYLAPVPFRGKRNSSLNLPLVVEELARIKGLSAEEVKRVTNENAKKMYRLGGGNVDFSHDEGGRGTEVFFHG
jgi:TatD DNase family protein